jgi:hypothetical protein
MPESKVKDILSEVVARQLVGELLTLIDATTSDKAQREAIKSLVRQSCQKALKELLLQIDKQLVDAKAVSSMTAKIDVKVLKGEHNVNN